MAQGPSPYASLKPSQKDLDFVANKAGDNWRSLLIHLGIDFPKIQQFLSKNGNDSKAACFEGLFTWLSSEMNDPEEPVTFGTLFRALREASMAACVSQLEEKLDSEARSAHKPTGGDLSVQPGTSKSKENPAMGNSSSKDHNTAEKTVSTMSRKRSPDVGHTSTLYQKKSKADQQAMQPSTTPVEDQRTLALRKAHEKLKSWYTRPVKSNMPGKVQFINLALVKRPTNPSKITKDVKDFLEATAHGIDRYYSKQKNIEYETILASTGNDSGKRVLISGSPGSGKTTLARKLCRDLSSGHLPNQYKLVLFTELKVFRSYLQRFKKKASLVSLLESLGLGKYADSLCSMIEEEEGRGVAIILDGYDEISDDEMLSEWASDVFTCAALELNVSQCDVFITTRPSQLPQLTKDAYVHLEVLGFSHSDIDCYIKAYFEGAPDRAEEVNLRLTDLPLVRGLCSNPRVLQIACEVLKHLDEEPLPANLSGIFLRYLCYQLEVDLTQRQPPVKTRVKDLLSISEELFPGFYPLCSLAYKCCLRQQLMLDEHDLKLGEFEMENYISSRGSVYNLLFREEVHYPASPMSCMLYQCNHKTEMEALAAVHIAVLSPAEQQQIWEEWFTAPHMAQVWMMYCGLTGLKSVDLTRLCFLTASERSRDVVKDLHADAFKDDDKLVMVSLFEASNDEKAKQVLPVLLKNNIRGHICSQNDVLVLAYSITHHHHLSRVELHLHDWSELDLKPLTTSLKNVKAVELMWGEMEPMLTVLPRAVEELSLVCYNNSVSNLQSRQAKRTLLRRYRGRTSQEWTQLLGEAVPCEDQESHAVVQKGIFSPLEVVPHLKYSMEALKNLLVHREKCSLEMPLDDHQLSALLSGLKRADKLKELDLNIKLSRSEVNLNQCLLTCAQVAELVATHPYLVKVDVNSSESYKLERLSVDPKSMVTPVFLKRDDLLIAVAKGAVRNKNVSHLGLGRDISKMLMLTHFGAQLQGLGCHITNAVHPLLCSPSADHITSVRAKYRRGLYRCGLDDDDDDDGDGDAWSKGVIAGPMSRQTCHLYLREITPALLGLLLSRLNTATKLKDLSLTVTSDDDSKYPEGHHLRIRNSIEDHNPVDVCAVETAFQKCNLRKLRIESQHNDGQPVQWYRLYSAILTGLAANTTTQVDSHIYRSLCTSERPFDVEEITRPLSQQTLQRFEVVNPDRFFKIISRNPSCPSAPVPAPGPLLNTPSQPTSPIAKPETTPPGQTTPTHQTTPPDPTPTPPDVGERLEKYKDRILSDVMSSLIFNRLEVEKVISDSVALEISKTTNREGNCLIYKHLMEQSDLKSLQTFGTVLAEEEGNAKMQRLGRDLLAEITLPHGSS